MTNFTPYCSTSSTDISFQIQYCAPQATLRLIQHLSKKKRNGEILISLPERMRWISRVMPQRYGMVLKTFLCEKMRADPMSWVLLFEESRKTATETRGDPKHLTSREFDVLEWVVKGKTNNEIGFILQISPRTVSKHLEHIFQKLGVESRTAAVIHFFEQAQTLGKSENPQMNDAHRLNQTNRSPNSTFW